jgi:transposase
MPAQPPPPRSRAKQKRDPGHNLLRRLHYYKAETLAFLRRPGEVPFTNNEVERDLRMMKLKQKISGCFRSWGGALAFCRIRSFLQTARKQDLNPFAALSAIFPPILPATT